MTTRSIIDWALGLPQPLVLGIQGPQGAGKSTLSARLVAAAQQQGLRAFACSLDDFYLTRAQQQALAGAFAGNRALEHRGYPGTHDVPLALSTLRSLIAGQPTRVPVYDKSAFEGRGDRAPEARWPLVEGPLNILIFEGWMLGFQLAAEAPPELTMPNWLLSAYAPLWALLDAMILLETADLQQIVAWRVDAERARRARGEGALSDAETLDYIQRFLPAYQTWLPGLYAAPPGRHHLRVMVGPERLA